MKNKIKKNIHRTLSVFMIVLLMLGVVPIVGVNAAEKVSDFEYSVLDDGTVEITRYIDDGSSDVIIPEVIEGKIVTSISDACFCEFTGPASGFENIESIFIPKTVNNLAEYDWEYDNTKNNCWTFSKLPNLKEISVDEENEKYSSNDGVLFDKKKETLMYYPRAKQSTEYTVPNTVRYINNCSFYQNVFLQKLKFSDKLNQVALDAIYNLKEVEYPILTIKPSDYEYVVRYCPNLKKVTIGREVNFIPEYEFHDLKEYEKDVTLYVYDNSYALEWAKEHGFAYKIIEEPTVAEELIDTNTGITVKGTMNPDTTLDIEKVENTVDNSVATYDITLKNNGVLIQPESTITISIPSTEINCKVVCLKDDGTVQDMNAEYNNGYYVFETDHLSKYAIIKTNIRLKGDVDNNGIINVVDATDIQKYVVNLTDENGNKFIDINNAEDVYVADVNGDGIINVVDATLIQKYIVRLVESL